MQIPVHLEPRLLHILQHSLGCDQHGRGTYWRNHFCADESSDDGKLCLQLVAAGLMINRGSLGELSGCCSCFCVTAEGKEVVRKQSPPPEKLSRSKMRYLEYLAADSVLTFGEWIKEKRSV